MRIFYVVFFTFIFTCKAIWAESVLITGANQGIGLGFIRYYLKQGYKVYGTYRSKEKSRELLAINDKNFTPIQVDFEDPDAASANVKSLLKNDPLDILILNAGYFAEKANNFGNLETKDFQRSFNVNTISPLILAQGLKENLLAGKEKKIVAISSRRGSIQQTKEEKYKGSYAYRTSKAALNAGMSALALEMPEITVLILHPGHVKTEFTKFDPKSLSVEQSIKSIAEIISAARLENSGKFYDYKWEILPW